MAQLETLSGDLPLGSAPDAARPAIAVVRPLLDVSVVLPCLDEADAVGQVVRDALEVLERAGLRGEVIVADNGSTDGSDRVARDAGARVVYAPERGYGNAYHAGMAVARGRVLVMADADGTYPMEALPALVAPVVAGDADMVIGNRMHSRDGRGAMPWLHRRVGTPLLTGVLNRFSRVAVADAHSGMRAIDSATYRGLGLVTPGMEYASEMIVKAARRGVRMAEVPIDYRPRVGESKLQTWPDGWRHLKYLMLSSPTWLFLIPGLAMFVLGALILAPLTIGRFDLGPIHMDVHPMILGAGLAVLGYQMLQFGVLIRVCLPLTEGVADRVFDIFVRHINLERVLLAGAAVFLVGFGVLLAILVRWWASGFGPLADIRLGITGLTICIVGAQTVFAGFLYAFFLPATFGGGVSAVQLSGRPLRLPDGDD